MPPTVAAHLTCDPAHHLQFVNRGVFMHLWKEVGLIQISIGMDRCQKFARKGVGEEVYNDAMV